MPAVFIKKSSDSELRGRQGLQEHFIDLCRMLGVSTPAEDDPGDERFCFEPGAEKVGGGAAGPDGLSRCPLPASRPLNFPNHPCPDS